MEPTKSNTEATVINLGLPSSLLMRRGGREKVIGGEEKRKRETERLQREFNVSIRWYYMLFTTSGLEITTKKGQKDFYSPHSRTICTTERHTQFIL